MVLYNVSSIANIVLIRNKCAKWRYFHFYCGHSMRTSYRVVGILNFNAVQADYVENNLEKTMYALIVNNVYEQHFGWTDIYVSRNRSLNKNKERIWKMKIWLKHFEWANSHVRMGSENPSFFDRFYIINQMHFEESHKTSF